VVLSPQQQRARKWMRKAALREILGAKHRLAACNRHPVKQAKAVEVWAKLDAYLPGHFVGLQTCALPWLCPICSPKIGERRAGEIQKAMAQCLAEGGQVLMPTFTIPHGRQQSLAETLDLIKQALRWMGSTRAYKELQERLNVEGRIIATEVTHGEANGWHPHFHELWFFEVGGVDVAALEEALYGLWVKACRKFGLDEPSRRHGVVVQDGAQAAKYVSKMGDKGWTLADEMAKANAKSGRQGNRSFWQLIDCAIDDDATPQHRNRAKRLIEEYEQATKGRRALVWTPGLKKRFAVVEMTDEELAEQVEAEAVLIAEIPLEDWKVITRHRLESVVLDACLNGREAVFSIIEAFRAKEA
jgi:DNA-binding TFAR19-related protein (PDSD5 family)